MRVYLAGPITGHADLNRPAFEAAARWAQEHGWTPVSPLDADPQHDGPCPPGLLETGATGSHSRACWLRVGLAALLTCDAIVLVDGWEHSAGALLEYRVAIACGLVIRHAPVEVAA